jgi:hypothetical protein
MGPTKCPAIGTSILLFDTGEGSRVRKTDKRSKGGKLKKKMKEERKGYK